MAERIVSPGVFTQENDLSFLPVGIGEIGAVIIGGTESGPAFMPVQVRSMNEFELRFGSSTKGTYVPFTVKEYIKSAGVVTIVRTLGLDGFTVNNQVYLIASGSDIGPSGSTVGANTDPYIVGVIHASTTGDNSTKDGLLQETSVITGTATGGAFATSSATDYSDTPPLVFNVASIQENVNPEIQIGTSGTNEFRFIGVGGTTAPADDADPNGPYYFLTGSFVSTFVTNLAAEINAHASSLVTVAADTDILHVTASALGIAGNSITVQTGSATQGITTQITLAGGLAQTGTATALDSALTGNGVISMAKFMGNSGHLSSTSNTMSLDKTNANYLPNLLGTDPGNTLPTAAHSINNSPSYVYSLFNSQSYGAADTNNGGGYRFTKLSASLDTIDFDSAAASVTGTNSNTSGKEYAAARTPWVVSQTTNGNNFPLFRIHTFAHGTNSNRYYKVSVTSIKKAGSVSGQDYGNFSITIRKIDDSDNKVIALESYSNCNLDPNSPNYIARLIGDRDRSYDGAGKLITTGDYPNISRYVRVEVHESVRNAVYSEQLVPFGHEAYISPFSVTVADENASTDTAYYPEVALVTSRSLETDTVTYFGMNFNEDILNNGMYNYLAPLSDTAAVGKNRTFLLSSCTNGSTGGEVGLDSALNNKRFTLGFQGGFDGKNPAKQIAIGKDLASGNSFGYSFASTGDEGYRVYKKAIDTVANPDEIDINLIVAPGILTQNASNIVAKVIEVCEDRGDAFYIVDGVNSLNGDSVTAATTQAANYDTNYAAMYYPWVRVFDATVNKFLFVPPSVVVPGVMSFNDKVAFPWFAPAGLNRGSLTTVTEPYTRLTHSERDELYEGKVNPIAIFPNTGVCIWGQKTLQTKPSALDRINVRRLLIKLKKFIASSTRYLVFENNTTATRNRFLNIVNPYLETVQQQQGLYAFKVVMDESNNTPDVVDRNQMKGEIFLQPAKAAEFIIVDFNIMRTGASFEE